MKETKSNKGLIITLIIIIVIMFFTIIGLSFSLVIQKYRCAVVAKTLNTVDKTVDKGLDTVNKFFEIVTKENNGKTIPFINYDSDDAEDINDDIEEFYNKMNSYGDATYKTYSNDNIESIIIKYTLGGTNTYAVFNINKESGKKVTSEELMKKKNITLDGIKIRMKAIWIQKVKTSEGYSMPTSSNSNISVENATKANIDKLTNDNIVLYLNEDGHLCVVYEEYQISGSETGYYIMDLDKYLYTELK